jgi:hypothetical protein
VLYRVFPLDPRAGDTEDGGALYAPRALQGGGRHDNPDHFTALYASRAARSALAERLQRFRGREISDEHLTRPDGRRFALVAIEDSRLGALVDLDEPTELVRRDLRPSSIATGQRAITQPIALVLFREGGPGFGWWSTIEATWANVTLFAERAVRELRIDGEPEVLTTALPLLVEVAERIGVRLARR